MAHAEGDGHPAARVSQAGAWSGPQTPEAWGSAGVRFLLLDDALAPLPAFFTATPKHTIGSSSATPYSTAKKRKPK